MEFVGRVGAAVGACVIVGGVGFDASASAWSGVPRFWFARNRRLFFVFQRVAAQMEIGYTFVLLAIRRFSYDGNIIHPAKSE